MTKYQVLIVEDERIIRNALRDQIPWDDWGSFDVNFEASGTAAIRHISYNPPDILITDIRMPGINGLQVAEELLGLKPHARVIVISGYKDPTYMQKAIHLNAIDYIFKPVRKPELEIAVRKACEALDNQTDMHEITELIEEERKLLINTFFRQLLEPGKIEDMLINRLTHLGIDVSASYSALALNGAATDRCTGADRALSIINMKKDTTVLVSQFEFNSTFTLLILRIDHSFTHTDLHKLTLGLNDLLSDLDVRVIRPTTPGIAKGLGELTPLLKLLIVQIEVGSDTVKGCRESDGLVSAVKKTIHGHFWETTLSVTGLSMELGKSKSYLCNHFKQQTGTTINQYITLMRLEEAKRLMRESTLSLQDIADESGFDSENYLARVFRKYEGLTPSAYRSRL